MSVDNTHPEYRQKINRWSLVRDIVGNDAKHLLPVVDPDDRLRNEKYKNRAILTNFTALTKVGLQGLVFQKPTKIKLPKELEYLEYDATGTGLNLNNVAKDVLGEVLITGRCGILVDYPRLEGNLSLLEQEIQQITAKLLVYRAESIINWDTITIGGKTKLRMVVLKEVLQELEEDGFTWEEKDQYRVLLLDNSLEYIQVLYNNEFEIVDSVKPLDASGNPFKSIPFQFAGAEENDTHVDKSPLYDLAVLNLGHYRNSADYEEAAHIVGQPTLFFSTEFTPEQFKEANPNGIKFGARAGYNLGAGGSASLLQAQPNQMIQEAMRSKEKQAAFLGARLISEPGGRETAEGVRMRFSSQNSVLYNVVLNVEDALYYCLSEYVAAYMGANSGEIVFKLNKQFYDQNTDPNLLAQSIMLFDRALISQEDILDYLKKTNFLREGKSADEIRAELENLDPMMGIDNPEDGN